MAKALLERFATVLKKIEAQQPPRSFVVVPTQGTLVPNESDWQNEIHPTSEGFVKIARKFQASLQAAFHA